MKFKAYTSIEIEFDIELEASSIEEAEKQLWWVDVTPEFIRAQDFETLGCGQWALYDSEDNEVGHFSE